MDAAIGASHAPGQPLLAGEAPISPVYSERANRGVQVLHQFEEVVLRARLAASPEVIGVPEGSHQAQERVPAPRRINPVLGEGLGRMVGRIEGGATQHLAPFRLDVDPAPFHSRVGERERELDRVEVWGQASPKDVWLLCGVQPQRPLRVRCRVLDLALTEGRAFLQPEKPIAQFLLALRVGVREAVARTLPDQGQAVALLGSLFCLRVDLLRLGPPGRCARTLVLESQVQRRSGEVGVGEGVEVGVEAELPEREQLGLDVVENEGDAEAEDLGETGNDFWNPNIDHRAEDVALVVRYPPGR
ncbi:MAG: hypothetical protein ACT4PE_14120 [Candidatus Eiseniibacteriota bacterium]